MAYRLLWASKVSSIPKIFVAQRRFTHEWAKIEGNKATFGVTHYAECQIGDKDNVVLPELGSSVTQYKVFASLTNVCGAEASVVHSPMSGTIVEVNENLIMSPKLVHTDPFTDGWIIKVELSDASEADRLLSPNAYFRFIK